MALSPPSSSGVPDIQQDLRDMTLNPGAPCHLLALPREVRDMIIDDVLLRSDRPPNDCPFPCNSNRSRCKSNRQMHIPPLAPDASLLRTCHQLNAETMQRAAALDIPLMLDILVTSDWRVQCSWLNVPRRKSWEGIRMEVKVRIKPESLRYPARSVSCRECFLAFRGREQRVGRAFTMALLKTLRARGRNTTIERLRVSVGGVPDWPRREDGVEELEGLEWDLFEFTHVVIGESGEGLFWRGPNDAMIVLEQVQGIEWWMQGALKTEWCFDRMLRDDEKCREFPGSWSRGEPSYKALRRRFRLELRGWE